MGEDWRRHFESSSHVNDRLRERFRPQIGDERVERGWDMKGVLGRGDGEGFDRPRSEVGVKLFGQSVNHRDVEIHERLTT